MRNQTAPHIRTVARCPVHNAVTIPFAILTVLEFEFSVSVEITEVRFQSLIKVERELEFGLNIPQTWTDGQDLISMIRV